MHYPLSVIRVRLSNPSDCNFNSSPACLPPIVGNKSIFFLAFAYKSLFLSECGTQFQAILPQKLTGKHFSVPEFSKPSATSTPVLKVKRNRKKTVSGNPRIICCKSELFCSMSMMSAMHSRARIAEYRTESLNLYIFLHSFI